MNKVASNIAEVLGCDSERFEQKRAIGLIENPFNSPWTTVYDTSEEPPKSLHIFSCFARADLEAKILSGQDWLKYADDFSPCFCKTPNGVMYEEIGSDGFDFIVAEQCFHSLNEVQLILNQEFILLLELYRGTNGNYYEVDESGDKQIAVEFLENKVRVKTKYLMRFMSAKQLLYVQFIDSKISSAKRYPMTTISISDNQFVSESYNYSLLYRTTNEKDFLFSMIYARSIVKPQPVEECGIWPYEKSGEYYPEFIIRELPDGSSERYTCDESKLGNYFGGNPGAPHYLTPVYFSPQVLDKYRKSPNFEVSERRLTCGTQWSVEIDNVNPDRVMVFLGDLGRDLPEAERRHFREYEITPTDQKISKEVTMSDFFGMWVEETEGPIGKFGAALSELQKSWQERFGTRLYRNLHPDDSGLLDQIRIPSTSSQEEFESIVLSLQRLLIEYMDESQFPKTDSVGSINRLETFLRENNISIDCSPLRNLQDLRSAGTAHAKGKKYEKLKERLISGDPIEDTKSIIALLTDFMTQLTATLNDYPAG